MVTKEDFVSGVKKFHPEWIDVIEEYASEAEHQDGAGYWGQFPTLDSVLDDFLMYCYDGAV